MLYNRDMVTEVKTYMLRWLRIDHDSSEVSVWSVTLDARSKFHAMRMVRNYWHVHDSAFGHMFDKVYVYVRPGNRFDGYWREVKVKVSDASVFSCFGSETEDISDLVRRES